MGASGRRLQRAGGGRPFARCGERSGVWFSPSGLATVWVSECMYVAVPAETRPALCTHTHAHTQVLHTVSASDSSRFRSLVSSKTHIHTCIRLTESQGISFSSHGILTVCQCWWISFILSCFFPSFFFISGVFSLSA